MFLMPKRSQKLKISLNTGLSISREKENSPENTLENSVVRLSCLSKQSKFSVRPGYCTYAIRIVVIIYKAMFRLF